MGGLQGLNAELATQCPVITEKKESMADTAANAPTLRSRPQLVFRPSLAIASAPPDGPSRRRARGDRLSVPLPTAEPGAAARPACAEQRTVVVIVLEEQRTVRFDL